MIRQRASLSGFTLVELIMTIIVIGILAVVIAPRFFDTQTYDVRTFMDQARALIRHGQKTAIAQNRNVYVRLNGASVALCFDPGCSAAGMLVASPSGNNTGTAATKAACVAGGYQATWACEGVPSGAAYAAVPASAGFYFDPSGKPFNVADPPPTTVSSFARLTLNVTGDGATRPIVIEPETGYVH